MKHLYIAMLSGFTILLAISGVQPVAYADKDDKKHKERPVLLLGADLTGYEEPPAVSSTGSGKFRMKISPDETSFDYELSYENLEGDVRQSHIHIAQKGVNGGITVWLCETATNPSPSPTTPACENPDNPLDTRSGRASGTATAADVIGPAGQGVAAGEFAEVLQALRTGVTYANVHSSRNTGGEVRGQIQNREKHVTHD